MIRIDKQEVISEVPNVTVWGDHLRRDTFYALPSSPRFRRQDGLPVFKFIKYRLPIDRPDGKKGGGYVFFDTELAVSDTDLAKLQQALDTRLAEEHRRLGRTGAPPTAKLGTITYVKGDVNLLLEKDGVLIEKVMGAGHPSLYGNNVASFAVELSPEGAAVFEAAMQGAGASMVSVVYKLHFWVKLPPLTATVWFNASKFYSFYQEVDTDWNVWGEDSYHETMREKFIESGSGGSEINFDFTLPDPEQDKKLKDKIRDWADRTLEDMVEKAMIESIAPVSEDKRKVPDGIEDVTRDISVTKAKSFRQTFKENGAAEWNLNPQGNLGTITSLTGPDGKALQWSDYSMTVDADDPFFRQLNVSIMTNADFERLGIHSIEVKINYTVGSYHRGDEFRFTKPDDVHRFATYVENNVWSYKYSYQVNYKGSSKIFQSEEIETDETELTINVDDTGVFILDVEPGDLNFTQVSQVQLLVAYEDSAHGVQRFERQCTIDENNRQHTLRELILEPTRKPYTYRAKYFMTDGKEYSLAPVEGLSDRLYVNDPFSETRTVGIRAIGDLENEVDIIFVDLKYLDEENDYSQTKSVALSKSNPFDDWSFPVISPTGGRVVYSGNIRRKDGTVEEIEETLAKGDTLLVGPRVEDVLEVEVLPDLIDFTAVKLARVSLEYQDQANGIDERHDIIFRQGASGSEKWSVDLKDKSKNQYRWKVTFYLVAGGSKEIDWQTTTEPTLLPELPA